MGEERRGIWQSDEIQCSNCGGDNIAFDTLSEYEQYYCPDCNKVFLSDEVIVK